MKLAIITIATFVAAATLLGTADAYETYQSQIPNGNRVPSPCQEGTIWSGVGHERKMGTNARNRFGMDFSAAGHKWTADLCRKDSDRDGLTNGQELGDPECVWTPGATPARTTGLSHPGICPLSSTTCTNSWTVCPKAFSCPALSEASVTVRNFTLKSTAVPAKITTYMCQAFELNNTATAVHMIGSTPIIVNKNVMHHMILYACTKKPEQKFFNGPQTCFMTIENCIEMLNLWAFGGEGECFNNKAGFLIGGAGGYQYAVLQLHWNNVGAKTGYTDASGFSLYFTDKLRTFNQGTAMNGEVNLVLPPRQPNISVTHTCPSKCTELFHTETRYITSATIHMHTLGIQGRVSLWRNGSLIKDLSPLHKFEYNSPQMHLFEPPIEYHEGDEVKTECYFSTKEGNQTVFFGESTKDEMCLSFLSYYPNVVSVHPDIKLSRCVSVSGINLCLLGLPLLRPGMPSIHVEQGCNITGMLNEDIPKNVLAEMTANSCFNRTGCDPACRKYLNNILWPSNACYDPKRARQMAEVMTTGILAKYDFKDIPKAAVKLSITKTLFGQRFCEKEISDLAELDRRAALSASVTATPVVPARPSGLTSEHLLIIIIVCSCLGFVLLLAALAVLAGRIRAAGASVGAAGAADAPQEYRMFENDGTKAESVGS